MSTQTFDISMTGVAPVVSPSRNTTIDRFGVTSSTRFAVNVDEPLFEPIPSRILFDDYEGYQEYTAQVSVRNKDMVARRVRLELPESPHFSLSLVENSASQATKVAPGMSLTYTLTFKPHARRDYSVDILCITERESFFIPVKALSELPKIDLPTTMNAGRVPCNKKTMVPVLMRNLGEKAAHYTINCGPHVTLPTTAGTLHGTALTQLKVELLVPKTGPLSTYVDVLVDGGLTFRTNITADVYALPVSLDSNTITAPATYIHVTSQKLARITNNGDVPVKFAFRTFASEAAERNARSVILREIDAREQVELEEVERQHWDAVGNGFGASMARTDGFAGDLCHSDSDSSLSSVDSASSVSSRDDTDMSVVSHIPHASAAVDLASVMLLQQRRAAVSHRYAAERAAAMESPLYSYGALQLSPLTGELYPGQHADLTLQFLPDTPVLHKATAFLECEGVQGRTPITLTGLGIGPKAVLDYGTLDVGTVFIHSVKHHSVRLTNVGGIPVSFHVDSKSDRCKVTPASGHLALPNTEGARGGSPSPSPQSTATITSSATSAGVDSVDLQINFAAHTVGEFSEDIAIQLEGALEPVVLHVKGTVIGPTFTLDPPNLDFGDVCYGYLSRRTLTINNTSQVPMKYRLRIPQDTAHAQHTAANPDPQITAALLNDGTRSAAALAQGAPEFTLTPSTAVILPKQQQQVTLEFVPHSVGSYNATPLPGGYPEPGQGDPSGTVVSVPHLPKGVREPYKLVVDVLGVGDNIAQVPIAAKSKVHVPVVLADSINVGTCFLQHPCSATLPIRNDHDLDAKVEVLPQDPLSAAAVTLTTSTPTLPIAPNTQAALPLTLTPRQLGPFSIPLYVRVPGCAAPPIHVLVKGTVVGPTLSADKQTLNFGAIPVLKPHAMTVTLTNSSPIPAHYKAILRKSGSAYSVDEPVGVVPPKSQRVLTVTACVNENVWLSDTLILIVQDSKELNIAVKAKGEGTTMQPDRSIAVIDHGHVLTRHSTTQTFRIVNRGRRAQTLFWSKLPSASELATAEQSLGKKQSLAQIPESEDDEPEEGDDVVEVSTDAAKAADKAALKRMRSLSELVPCVFTISPARITLPPDTAMDFTVSGSNTVAGAVKEVWVCRAVVGGNSQTQAQDIHKCRIKCNFVDPAITFASADVRFDCHVSPDVPTPPQVQSLTLTNPSPLPLTFSLRTPYPFSLSEDTMTLEPRQSRAITVAFDPTCKHDRESAVIEALLAAHFHNHVNTSTLPLTARMSFPNLTFAHTTFDLGCVNNHTSKRFITTMTNTSPLPVSYAWQLTDASLSADLGLPLGCYTTVDGERVRVPPSQLINVAPLSGVLAPGASQEVEVLFFAGENTLARAVAQCTVQGGPLYELGVLAESSQVSFRMDRANVHLGACALDSVATAEVVVTNTGRVPLDYSLDTTTLSPLAAKLLSFSPTTATLAAGQKLKVVLTYRSAVPCDLREHVRVNLGFFDPIVLPITALGVYPTLLADLPRARAPVPCAAEAEALVAERLRRADASCISEAHGEVVVVPESKRHHRKHRSESSYAASAPAVTPLPLSVPPLPLSSRSSSRAAQQTLTSSRGPRAAPQLLEPASYGVPIVDVPLTASALVALEAERLQFVSFLRELVLQGEDTRKHAAQYPLAHYTMDLGHLVLGRGKQRTFTLTNPTSNTISVDLNKDAFHKTVFTVEPCSLRIPPGQSQEVIVSCATNMQTKKGQSIESLLQPQSVALPFAIRGCGVVTVSVTAGVTLPSFTPSLSLVPMDTVYVGTRKEYYLQLVNDRPVPCEWAMKAISGLPQKDRACVEVFPSSGSLQPGAHCNICVAYTPSLPGPLATTIVFKVSHNPVLVYVKVKGEARHLDLHVSPSALSVPPVQPYQISAPGSLVLHNASQVPVEMFCSETDTVHVAEEQVLLEDDQYDEHGVQLVFPPRAPGDQLPLPILQRHHARRRAAALAAKREHLLAERVAAAVQRARDELAVQGVVAEEDHPVLVAAAEEEKERMRGEERVAKKAKGDKILAGAAPDAPTASIPTADVDAAEANVGVGVSSEDAPPVNLVFVGTPFAGVSSLVKHVVAEGVLGPHITADNVVTLDKAVAHYYALDVEVEERHKQAEAREKDRNKKGVAPVKRLGKKGDDVREESEEDVDAAFWAAHDGRDLALAAEVRSRITRFRVGDGEEGKRGKSKSDEEEDPLADTSDIRAHTMALAAVTNGNGNNGVPVLDELLLVRVFAGYVLREARERLQHGLLLDGLDSAYIDSVGCARVVRRALQSMAMERDNAMHVLAVSVPAEEARRRALNEYEECKRIATDKEITAQTKRFKPLPEKEIAKLSDDKRHKYEDMVLLVHQRKRAERVLKKLACADMDRLMLYYGPAIGDISELRVGVGEGVAAAKDKEKEKDSKDKKIRIATHNAVADASTTDAAEDMSASTATSASAADAPKTDVFASVLLALGAAAVTPPSHPSLEAYYAYIASIATAAATPAPLSPSPPAASATPVAAKSTLQQRRKTTKRPPSPPTPTPPPPTPAVAPEPEWAQHERALMPALSWAKHVCLTGLAPLPTLAARAKTFVSAPFVVPFIMQTADPAYLPPPRVLQLIRRPTPRAHTPVPRNFRLQLLDGTPATRVVLAAQGSLQLQVLFAAHSTGTYAQQFTFEPVHALPAVTASVTGVCSVPGVDTAATVMFDKGVLHQRSDDQAPIDDTISPLARTLPPHKHFSSTHNLLSFGPLLVGASRDLIVCSDEALRSLEDAERQALCLRDDQALLLAAQAYGLQLAQSLLAGSPALSHLTKTQRGAAAPPQAKTTQKKRGKGSDAVSSQYGVLVSSTVSPSMRVSAGDSIVTSIVADLVAKAQQQSGTNSAAILHSIPAAIAEAVKAHVKTLVPAAVDPFGLRCLGHYPATLTRAYTAYLASIQPRKHPLRPTASAAAAALPVLNSANVVAVMGNNAPASGNNNGLLPRVLVSGHGTRPITTPVIPSPSSAASATNTVADAPADDAKGKGDRLPASARTAKPTTATGTLATAPTAAAGVKPTATPPSSAPSPTRPRASSASGLSVASRRAQLLAATHAQQLHLHNPCPFPISVRCVLRYRVNSLGASNLTAEAVVDADKRGKRTATRTRAVVPAPMPKGEEVPVAALGKPIQRSKLSEIDPARAAAASRPSAASPPTTSRKSNTRTAAVGDTARYDRQAEEEARVEALKSEDVFVVDTASVTIAPHATHDITVWAFPQASGVFYDELIVCVADNPQPHVIPLRCEGTEPQLALSRTEVAFGKVLLGATRAETLTLTNPGSIPLAWSLRQHDLMLASNTFTVSATSGVLMPGQTDTLTVTMRALAICTHDWRLELDVRDVERVRAVVDTHVLSVTAQVIRVEASIGTSTEHGLDFGNVRAGEAVAQTLTITNQGPDSIQFQLSIAAGSLLHSMLTLSPAAGIVAAGATATVTATLKHDRALTLGKCADLTIAIADVDADISGAAADGTAPLTHLLPLSARVHTATPFLSPSSGLCFPPSEAGVTSTLSFRLSNDGIFPFQFHLFPADSAHPLSRANILARAQQQADTDPVPGVVAAKSPARKQPAVASRKPPRRALTHTDKPSDALEAFDSLELGPFTVSPCAAVVEVGAHVDVTVTLSGDLVGAFAEVLEVLVSELPAPVMAALTAAQLSCVHALSTYELVADVCGQGMETDDLYGVFEEVEVLPALPEGTLINAFTTADRTLTFAPVIVTKHTVTADDAAVTPTPHLAASSSTASTANLRRGSSVARRARDKADKDAQMEQQTRTVWRSSSQRVRIANPHKVPCTVQLRMWDAHAYAQYQQVLQTHVLTNSTNTASTTNANVTTVINDKAKAATVKAGKTKQINAAPALSPAEALALAAAEAAANAANGTEPLPFTLSHSALTLGPHQHTYVTITFTPTQYRRYTGVFEAVLAHPTASTPALPSAAPNSHLTFNVCGCGAVPTIKVTTAQDTHDTDTSVTDTTTTTATASTSTSGDAEPAAGASVTAAASLTFPRVFLGPEHGTPAADVVPYTLPFTIHNTSPIPAIATAHIHPAPHADSTDTSAFTLLDAADALRLQPGEQHTLRVSFRPRRAGMHIAEVRVCVADNPNEPVRVSLVGEGHCADVTVSGLDPVAPGKKKEERMEGAPTPASATASTTAANAAAQRGRKSREVSREEVREEVCVGDLSRGAAYTRTVTVHNHSDSAVRYRWVPVAADDEEEKRRNKADGATAAPEWTISPQVGHIPAGGSARVALTYKSDEKRVLCAQPALRLIAQRVKYTDPRVVPPTTARGKQPAAAAATTAVGECWWLECPPEAVVWDNTMLQARTVHVSQLTPAAEPVDSKGKKKPHAHAHRGAAAAAVTASVAPLVPLGPPDEQQRVLVADALPEPVWVPVEEDSKRSKAANATAGNLASGSGSGSSSGSGVCEVLVGVSVTVDTPAVQCDVQHNQAVVFADTYMLQERVWTFTATNTASTALPFSWTVASPTNVSDAPPFTIAPAAGAVPPGAAQQFTVTFAPTDSLSYAATLTPSTPTAPAHTFPTLHCTGNALRPYIHLSLPPTDYLARRPAPLFPLPSPCNVFEVTATGLRRPHTYSFPVLNTTDKPLAFSWSHTPHAACCAAHTATNTVAACPVSCTTPTGTILPGRTMHMTFTFTPTTTAHAAHLFTLALPSLALSFPLLVAATALEPAVRAEPQRVDMGMLLLGANKVQQVTLRNYSDLSLPWDAAVEDRMHTHALTITPSRGVLAPRGTQEVTVTYTPAREGVLQGAVRVRVGGRDTPVVVPVRGECAEVRTQVRVSVGDGYGYGEGHGSWLAVCNDGGCGDVVGRADGNSGGGAAGGASNGVGDDVGVVNEVAMGAVLLGDTAVTTFTITNDAPVPLPYAWTFPAHLQPPQTRKLALPSSAVVAATAAFRPSHRTSTAAAASRATTATNAHAHARGGSASGSGATGAGADTKRERRVTANNTNTNTTFVPPSCISLSSLSGTIPRNSTVHCTLSFAPTRIFSLTPLVAQLTVGSHVYTHRITASVRTHNVFAHTQQHQFGTHTLLPAPTHTAASPRWLPLLCEASVWQAELRNDGDEAVTVSVPLPAWDVTAELRARHAEENAESETKESSVPTASTTDEGPFYFLAPSSLALASLMPGEPHTLPLPPHSSLSLPILFRPSRPGNYTHTLPLSVCGLYPLPLALTATATPLALHPTDNSTSTLNSASLQPLRVAFGTLDAGAKQTRTHTLRNSSAAPLRVSLDVQVDTPSQLAAAALTVTATTHPSAVKAQEKPTDAKGRDKHPIASSALASSALLPPLSHTRVRTHTLLTTSGKSRSPTAVSNADADAPAGPYIVGTTFDIPPTHTVSITATFAPTTALAPFSAVVSLAPAPAPLPAALLFPPRTYTPIPLLSLSAAASSGTVVLGAHRFPFPLLLPGASASLVTTLSNHTQKQVPFAFSHLPAHYTIHPSAGNLAPDQTITLTLTAHAPATNTLLAGADTAIDSATASTDTGSSDTSVLNLPAASPVLLIDGRPHTTLALTAFLLSLTTQQLRTQLNLLLNTNTGASNPAVYPLLRARVLQPADAAALPEPSLAANAAVGTASVLLGDSVLARVLPITATAGQPHTHSLVLHNPTHTPWTLTPHLSSSLFSLPARIRIPPRSNVTVPLTYAPALPTAPAQGDLASLALALPSGHALLWLLVGTATHPPHTHSALTLVAGETAHALVPLPPHSCRAHLLQTSLTLLDSALNTGNTHAVNANTAVGTTSTTTAVASANAANSSGAVNAKARRAPARTEPSSATACVNSNGLCVLALPGRGITVCAPSPLSVLRSGASLRVQVTANTNTNGNGTSTSAGVCVVAVKVWEEGDDRSTHTHILTVQLRDKADEGNVTSSSGGSTERED